MAPQDEQDLCVLPFPVFGAVDSSLWLSIRRPSNSHDDGQGQNQITGEDRAENLRWGKKIPHIVAGSVVLSQRSSVVILASLLSTMEDVSLRLDRLYLRICVVFFPNKNT